MSSEKTSYYKMTRFSKYYATDIFLNQRELIRIQFFYNLSFYNMPFVFYVYRSNYFESESVKKHIKYYEYGMLNSNFAYSKYSACFNIFNYNSVYIDIL